MRVWVSSVGQVSKITIGKYLYEFMTLLCGLFLYLSGLSGVPVSFYGNGKGREYHMAA